MTENEFMDLMREIDNYLSAEKVFIKNTARFDDVVQAAKIAKELFADMDVELKDDPLQLGSLSLSISGYDVTVRGKQEITLFQELIEKADNFEIYPVGDEKVKFVIMFNRVYTRVS